MMILKYVLPPKGIVTVEIPGGFKVVKAGFQAKTDMTLSVCIWVAVLPNNQKQKVNFHMAFTGETIPDDWDYVATAQESQVNMVIHVFMQRSEPQPWLRGA
jgi:hypothetical protein